jgi:Flp pilus assembly protein TadG
MGVRGGTRATGQGRPAGERGQTLVEFAMVLFFFVLIVVGLIDLSRAVYARHLVANAAREGARFATTNPPETAQDVDKIKAVAGATVVGFDKDTMSVGVSQPDENHVRVDVTYTFRPIAAFIFGGADGSGVDITMHSGSVMRMEWTYDEDEFLP